MGRKSVPPEPELLKQCGFPQFLFMRLLGVYFLLSDLTIIYAGTRGISARKNWQDFIRLFPVGGLILLYTLLFLGVTLLYYFVSKKKKTFAGIFDPVLLILSVIFFSCTIVWRGGDFFLAVIVALFALVFVIYGLSRIHPDLLNGRTPDGIRNGKRSASRSEAYVIFPVAALSVAVLIFLCETALATHRIYGTTTFDMGIFEQMFYSLSHRFNAVTTCERGYALSHFRVHASYILYMLVPIYKVFPGAETLIVSQAVLVVSGVIPVYLIARKKGFSGTTLFSCCVIYLFSLGILSPCYFHFHENAFLPPLLMWIFYAVENRKNILFCILCALTCFVKEDAILFVVCICLYLAFETKGKDRIRVLLTGGTAAAYFLAMSAWLSRSGDGKMMMSSRMHTLMTGENQSSLQIVGNILTNPGHALTVVTSEPEAFLILLEMLLPLLLMPFFTKKTHRLFLMVPFFTFNLLFSAAYVYAAQIRYQYAFGTATLLIYLAIMNISDFDKDRRTVAITSVAAVSVICAACMISPNLDQYEQYKNNRTTCQGIAACLEKIPQDASVTADDYYLPHLAARNEIYSLNFENFVMSGSNVVSLQDVHDTDYYVLDLTDNRESQTAELLKSRGYSEYARYEDYVVIYIKQQV
ncbi:MAG: DUF2079 domain-containing protein [Clostridiales bacterium]|nr:DUF2079 domain-containing protein [Clostridiales bacterium]